MDEKREIVINYNLRCRRCHRLGVTESGLCLRCGRLSGWRRCGPKRRMETGRDATKQGGGAESSDLPGKYGAQPVLIGSEVEND